MGMYWWVGHSVPAPCMTTSSLLQDPINETVLMTSPFDSQLRASSQFPSFFRATFNTPSVVGCWLFLCLCSQNGRNSTI
jgi:hypothetical protein